VAPRDLDSGLIGLVVPKGSRRYVEARTECTDHVGRPGALQAIASGNEMIESGGMR
jgi:hypothetical protein